MYEEETISLPTEGENSHTYDIYDARKANERNQPESIISIIDNYCAGWVTHVEKTPYNKFGQKRHGPQLEKEDLAALMTMQEAREARENRSHSGIGYVLYDHGEDRSILGVLDLDKCRDPQTGDLTAGAKTLIDIVNSVYLVSPSGTGIHILVFIPANSGIRSCNAKHFNLDDHKSSQLFTNGQYVRLGTQVGEASCNIEHLSTEAEASILKLMEQEAEVTGENQRDGFATMRSRNNRMPLAEARDILCHIDPDEPRADWLTVAMGLHDEFEASEAAYQLFDDWSAGELHSKQSCKYVGTDDCRRTMDSLKPNGGITMASVCKLAASAGADLPSISAKHRHDTIQPTLKFEGSGIGELVRRFGVTQEDIQDMKETELLYHDVFPRGHLINIAGEPGAGKTTVMEKVAGSLSEEKLDVYYLNSDIAAGDVPEAKRRADDGGYTLLAPDIKPGESTEGFVAILEQMADSDEDFSQVCIIIDTLKKTTEVINKQKASKLYKTLRSMTGRGCTIITLGHCNKYRDADGIPIFEGTGDIRSDFDEVALLFHNPSDFGEQITSIYWPGQGVPWTKSRAAVEPCSWSFSIPGREVRRLDKWVDTIEQSRNDRQAKKVEDLISCLSDILRSNPEGLVQTKVEKLADEKIGVERRNVQKVLKSGLDKHWTRSRGDKNSWIYQPIVAANHEGNPWD